ncbi:hypothetical protein, partial [Cetobacterium sp.]|uniref:hypothetical protein n=1 Tax=Cetobacterium sp. TaxID=2071632 RepID=UPI003F2DDDC1
KKYSLLEKLAFLKRLSREEWIQNNSKFSNELMKKLVSKRFYSLHIILLKRGLERDLKDFIKFKIIGRVK